MKIGLSFSRCVRDIVEGTVDIDDVLVVVARTDFNPNDDEQWDGIWKGYCGGSMFNMNMEWGHYEVDNKEHEQQFRNVSQRLYDEGKLHQPRQFGAYPRRLPHIWLETVLPSQDLDSNPTLKAAWNKFQTLAQLTGTNLDETHRV